jgi:hypothetical protein
MRRILSVLAVIALLMVAVAAPAFARNSFRDGDQPPGPPSGSGEGSGGGALVLHCESGNTVTNKNGTAHDNCLS